MLHYSRSTYKKIPHWLFLTYILNILGDITCPDPFQFCAVEVITGHIYPENDARFKEGLVYGAIGLVVLLILIIGLCCPGPRYAIQFALNRVLGIDVETGFAANAFMTEKVYSQQQPCRKYAKYVIVGSNVLTMLFGISCIVAVVIANVKAELAVYDTIVPQVTFTYNCMVLYLIRIYLYTYLSICIYITEFYCHMFGCHYHPVIYACDSRCRAR